MIFFWAETPDGWGIPGIHGPLAEDELDGYVQSGVYLIRGKGENLLVDSGNWTLPEHANGMGDFLVELLDVGGLALEVVHLPGHCPGHVGLWNPNTCTLYPGDLMHYPTPLGPYPIGDAKAHSHSIERCLDFAPELLLEGHGLSSYSGP